MTRQKIRIGIFGAGRGLCYGRVANMVDAEVVAVCDAWKEKADSAAQEMGARAYTDFDEFLDHKMDAVVIANFFHEHAPFSIRALERGLHVMSELIPCKTLSEGAALARAVEKSGKIYVFSENYPYFVQLQEMRRLYQAGAVGEMQYGEGEYVHPFSAELSNTLAPGLKHWRNHLPASYYGTHALGPIVYITNTRPVMVNSLCVPRFESDKENLDVRVNDTGAVTLCRMDNQSVVRTIGIHFRGLGTFYRIHGTRGQMETLRVGEPTMLRVRHEPWDLLEGEEAEKIYQPEFPEEHRANATQSGHYGSDYFTLHSFTEAIRKNEQPFFDVYRALDMTFAGIQAYKSAHENGAPFEVPDFRIEEVRKRYDKDHWSPFPEDRGPGQPFPSVKGEIKPSPEALAHAKNIWDKMGYKGE